MSTPFMQLYVADYLGDTRHLTTEQHGAYMLLLMTMWRAGGDLADDDEKLARIVCLTVARWRKIKADVINLLIVENGRVTQKRLTAELEKASKKSELRADAGRRGGEAKALKENKQVMANAIVLPKHSSEPDIRTRKKKYSVTKVTGGETTDELFGPAKPRDPTAVAKGSKKSEVHALLYARGRELLGSSAGGVITNLLRAYGDNAGKALAKLEDAAEHRDPAGWLHAFLHAHGPPGIEVGMVEVP